MPPRPTDPAPALPTPGPCTARERPERCGVRLIQVRSGVAEVRTRQRGPSIRSECWTLFHSREQFDECAADDPLRFADPLLFGQLKAEADHVFRKNA